jgi:glycosyltransferase involved in cell wall biosynthesis
MSKTISYALTVCNELEEITKLVTQLLNHIQKDDEIVIQYDDDTTTPEVLTYLEILENTHYNIKVIHYSLGADFSKFKNNLKSNCTRDYIFQIDADELVSEHLLTVLPILLDTNDVEAIAVPRLNTVEGLTDEWVKRWGWKVSNVDGFDEAVVNFPDLQWRIIKNIPNVRWERKVHEIIVGYETFTVLPLEPKYCLLHPKHINRQIRQNQFYDTIG